MKIFFHDGKIWFENFGGKNFVILDGTEGEFCRITMEAALVAQQSVQADGAVRCPKCQWVLRNNGLCPNCDRGNSPRRSRLRH